MLDRLFPQVQKLSKPVKDKQYPRRSNKNEEGGKKYGLVKIFCNYLKAYISGFRLDKVYKIHKEFYGLYDVVIGVMVKRAK